MLFRQLHLRVEGEFHMKAIYLKFKISLMLALIMLGEVACTPKQTVPQQPTPFNQAVQSLAHDLFVQLKDARGLLEATPSVIMLNPFIDGDSGNIVAVSQDIERHIHTEKAKNFSQLTLKNMTRENLLEAYYLMSGVINMEPYGNSREKHYHLYASILDIKKGEIVASSNIWVQETDLDFTPSALYKDSPMYLKDQHFESLVKIAKGHSGDKADIKYYGALQTNVILEEARNAYDNYRYNEALSLFKEAANRQDGQVMKAYAGLYNTYYKLGNMQGVEDAFYKMVAIGMLTNNLSTRFLFSVNTTEFIEDTELRHQYQLWLKKIAEYFQESKQCIEIIGHSSRSGTEAHNLQLSWQRADKIQQLLMHYAPHIGYRLTTVGKGFSENIVGTGTDDARDAIDRRVEFAVTGCPF